MTGRTFPALSSTHTYVNCITNYLDKKGACAKAAGHLTFAAAQLYGDFKVTTTYSRFTHTSTRHARLVGPIAASIAAKTTVGAVRSVGVVANTMVTNILPTLRKAVGTGVSTSLRCVSTSPRVHRDTKDSMDEFNISVNDPPPKSTRMSSLPTSSIEKSPLIIPAYATRLSTTGVLENSLHQPSADSGPGSPDIAGDGPVRGRSATTTTILRPCYSIHLSF